MERRASQSSSDILSDVSSTVTEMPILVVDPDGDLSLRVGGPESYLNWGTFSHPIRRPFGAMVKSDRRGFP